MSTKFGLNFAFNCPETPRTDDTRHNNDTTKQHSVKQQTTTTDAWGDSSTPAPPGRHRSTLTASITPDTTRKRMERWRDGWMNGWEIRWVHEVAVVEKVRQFIVGTNWDTERRQTKLQRALWFVWSMTHFLLKIYSLHIHFFHVCIFVIY